jgi:hypothetical protein
LKEVGAHSRIIDRAALGGVIDGRSKQGRFLRAYERMLAEHLGGNPSAVEKALVARAARLALHVELMDEKSLADGAGMSERDSRQYLAWSNSLARCLRDLGLKSKAATGPSLAEYLAS